MIYCDVLTVQLPSEICDEVSHMLLKLVGSSLINIKWNAILVYFILLNSLKILKLILPFSFICPFLSFKINSLP